MSKANAEKYLSKFLVNTVFTFGYIIPGHGLKGKQQVINEDSDLKTMYAIHFGKREIVLWGNSVVMDVQFSNLLGL